MILPNPTATTVTHKGATMIKGDKVLNVDYDLHNNDSLEYDGALLIDRINSIETTSNIDKWRKDNAIRCIVEAVMWAQNIGEQHHKINKFNMLER